MTMMSKMNIREKKEKEKRQTAGDAAREVERAVFVGADIANGLWVESEHS